MKLLILITTFISSGIYAQVGDTLTLNLQGFWYLYDEGQTEKSEAFLKFKTYDDSIAKLDITPKRFHFYSDSIVDLSWNQLDADSMVVHYTLTDGKYEVRSDGLKYSVQNDTVFFEIIKLTDSELWLLPISEEQFLTKPKTN